MSCGGEVEIWLKNVEDPRNGCVGLILDWVLIHVSTLYLSLLVKLTRVVCGLS